MNFEPETFGEIYAAEYDAEHDPGTTALAVERLLALADQRRTLELAIGTGRVALPLRACGLDVTGIEASPAMIERLRAKPGGSNVPVVVGDMATVQAGTDFGFAYLIFNTLFNLTSQEAQVACFANVAAHLAPRGEFLLETLVPAALELNGRDGLRTLKVDQQRLELEGLTHDPITQVVNFQRVQITEAGVRMRPLQFRYASPAEIDLMARLAGLVRVERWGDWHGGAFTERSRSHLSLYRKAV